MIRHNAFSLVELVIVVVIIGIISAIAIPRVSGAASGASDAALRATLATLRDVIDMYAAEHGGIWPGADGDDTTLSDQLTKNTDDAESVGTTPGVHIFGPYLRRIPPIPVGPSVGASGVLMTNNTPIIGEIDEGDDSEGWVYNYEIGEIIANSDDLDKDGKPYGSY